MEYAWLTSAARAPAPSTHWSARRHGAAAGSQHDRGIISDTVILLLNTIAEQRWGRPAGCHTDGHALTALGSCRTILATSAISGL